MSQASSRDRSAGPGTVILVAAGASAVNGFVVSAVRGAVGVVGREHALLVYWLVASAVLVPVYAAVVLLVLRAVAGRTQDRSGLVRTVTGVVAVAAGAALLGVAHLGVQAAWDTRVQTQQATSAAWVHFHAQGTDPVFYGGSARCNQLCVAKRETVQAHLRSIGVAAPVVLAADLLTVTWLVCAAGGDLVPTVRRRREEPVQPTGVRLPVVAGGAG